jgi:quinoprotein glucose dehydrogenase
MPKRTLKVPIVTFCAAAVLLLVGIAVVEAQPVMGEVPQTVTDQFLSDVKGVKVETWVQDLEVPWSLKFLPNGDALVAERPGRIQRIPKGMDQAELYAEIEVAATGDNGLLGMTLHPDFDNQPFVYAMHGYYPSDSTFRCASFGYVTKVRKVDSTGSSSTGYRVIRFISAAGSLLVRMGCFM